VIFSAMTGRSVECGNGVEGTILSTDGFTSPVLERMAIKALTGGGREVSSAEGRRLSGNTSVTFLLAQRRPSVRIILGHRERTLLAGDFEPPPRVDPNWDCVGFRLHRHPTSSAVTVTPLFGTNCVAVVWDSQSGELLWAPEQASEIGWAADGRSAYVIACKFGRGPRGGIGHRLIRYSWPGTEREEELVFSVPSGGADALVVSPAGRLAIVVAIQGPEWYYEVLGLLPTLSQLGVGHRIDDYLLDGPVFSPDERYIVTVGSPRFVWWAWPEEGEWDGEEWQVPSEGGLYELGWVYVHDLTSGLKTKHPLTVDLPVGWQPIPREGESDGWSWMVVWGPEFTGERSFRVWLPDGAPLDLQLPLPPTVEVPVLANRWHPPPAPTADTG
jgi:hypothetical protein